MEGRSSDPDSGKAQNQIVTTELTFKNQNQIQQAQTISEALESHDEISNQITDDEEDKAEVKEISTIFSE